MARNYLFARQILRLILFHVGKVPFGLLFLFESSRLFSSYHILTKKAIVLYRFFAVKFTTLFPIYLCIILLFILLYFLQHLCVFGLKNCHNNGIL